MRQKKGQGMGHTKKNSNGQGFLRRRGLQDPGVPVNPQKEIHLAAWHLDMSAAVSKADHCLAPGNVVRDRHDFH